MGDLVYLDVCCLKRAFDDQRQPRIQIETTAIAALIGMAERGEIRLVRSPAHALENDRNPREDRRLAAAIWLRAAQVEAPFTDGVAVRSQHLAARGFGPVDALHAAFAETVRARFLVTTDDQLVALGRRHRADLMVEIEDPVRVLDLLKEPVP